jgi:hypothetical protein
LFTFLGQIRHAFFQAGHTIMSISGISGFSAATVAQQVRNQTQAAQTRNTLQPGPNQNSGKVPRHHQAGDVAPPAAPGTVGRAGGNGSAGINTVA